MKEALRDGTLKKKVEEYDQLLYTIIGRKHIILF